MSWKTINRKWKTRSGKLSNLPRRLKRRGAAVVEAALVLGILLSLSLGGAEAGSYLWVKHAVEGAAWCGARAAINANATNADVQAAINTSLQNTGLQNYITYTVTPAASAAPVGTSVTVTVSYDWQSGGFHFLNLFGSTATGTAVMRKEGT